MPHSLWCVPKAGCVIVLTHLPLVLHICIYITWVIIGLYNGFSPHRHQAIAWTNVDFLSSGLLGTNTQFLFMKMHLKMSAKWRPLCPWRDELRLYYVLGILPPLTATIKQNCSQALSICRKNIEESVNACLVYYVKSMCTILTSLIFFAIYRVLVRQLIQNSSYHNQIISINIISRCCHTVSW